MVILIIACLVSALLVVFAPLPFVAGWLMVALGLCIGFAVASLWLAQEEPEDVDGLRDVYEEGLLAGHLTTVAGTFDRYQLGQMSAEWLQRRLEEDAEFAPRERLPAG